jgi:glycosyltransferase involved in cell wall biosynthesis
VLSSDSEGMPVALMEAAACGVPVVATAVGGVPDMVVEGMTGRVVPPGDPAAFAGALEELLSDPALRRRMGAAARRHAVERFSVAHQVDRLMEVWTRAIAPAVGVGG